MKKAFCDKLLSIGVLRQIACLSRLRALSGPSEKASPRERGAGTRFIKMASGGDLAPLKNDPSKDPSVDLYKTFMHLILF